MSKRIDSYEENYKGRKLVVVHRKMPDDWESATFESILGAMFDNGQTGDWYCGYMQVLPKDDDVYRTVADTSLDQFDKLKQLSDIFASSIGEITWAGHLPESPDDKNWYVGFDTNHLETENTTSDEVLTSLKNMADEAANRHGLSEIHLGLKDDDGNVNWIE